MRKWKSLVVLMIALALSPLLSGCQYLPAVLPIVQDVLTEIIDAQRKVDQLDQAVQGYFEKYPDPALEKQWTGVMDKVRASIDVALNAAHGVEDTAEKDVVGAMQNFVLVWQQARELAMSIGVVGVDGTLSAGPSAGYQLGEPIAVGHYGVAGRQ